MTMRTLGRRVVGALCAVGVVLATVILSRVAWQSADPDTAELRLSWRIPAPARQECRPPTEAELRDVLPHMRPAEVCTDEAIPFRLTIALDGDTLLSEPIVRSGPRARTITVFRSFRIPAGSYALEVAFLPELPPGPERGVTDAPARGSVPESVSAQQDLATTLRTRVFADPGDVILISPDETGQLVVIDPG
ncbi:MAG: hypothetical protein OXU74_07170 [Gemmatimonadota bacterium]|nr:hypothetical protein [Gemmatimonadota bacterium]